MNKKLLFCIVFITNVVFMLQAQNTSLPVGAIPGVIDVSPTGAVIYTIPIEVVPGAQGMQPNLSIVYNSMGGMGLLGMKWDLIGGSAITRCGQTPYYDNDMTAIQFNSNDRFSIDGERLIKIGTQSKYTTEIENFTQIFPYNSSTSEHHFIAYTDDGCIIEYGSTDNSRQDMNYNNTFLSWQIRKITDANGNYMTFYYDKYDEEIWIGSIEYTGNSNSGMTTHASVEFGCTTIPETMGWNTRYINGYGIKQAYILDHITIKGDNSVNGGNSKGMARKYQFNYVHKNRSGERAPHLNEIILYGEDGNVLNATTITWGEQNNDLKVDKTTLYNIPDGYFITGDFNGDGYSDYVVYGQGNQREKWVLYNYNPITEGFDSITTGKHVTISNFKQNCFFYKADLNGDGCDELIIAEELDADVNRYLFSILSLKNGISVITTKQVNHFHQLFFGDFDGDGKTDILFMKKNMDDPSTVCTFEFYMSYCGFTNNLDLPESTYSCKTRVGDFNGDGKTDIELNFANNKLYTCYFNNTSLSFDSNQQNSDSYLLERYSGDFNGDGITDLLTYTTSQDILKWKLYFGKGDGTYTDPTDIDDLSPLAEATPEGWIVPKNKIFIADLDGDGKDDILQHASSSLTVLYSKGCIKGEYEYTPGGATLGTDEQILVQYNISDFNNDGILDFIVQFKRNAKPVIVYHQQQHYPYEYPKEITDGLGKTLKFAYKPKYLLAKNDNYTRKYFYHILDSLQISNGLGDKLNLFQYQFKEPAFSDLKRTFLGFKEFVCTNENEKDVSVFALDNLKHILKPVSKTTYCNNIAWDITNYSFSFLELGNSYMPYANETTIKDLLLDIKTVTSISLTPSGRIATSNTKTYNGCNTDTWLHSETNTYDYKTITLNGNQQKTVPKSIITTQQYGNSGIVIADTLAYGYYPDTGTNKGRLHWSSAHGVSTTYEDYNSAGLYGKKTVTAPDVIGSRTEKYVYDATQRFVTKITNPLGFETSLTYDYNTGNKLSETDINGLMTTYKYDVFGNLKQINYPDGTQTKNSIHWHTEINPPNASYYVTTITTGKPDLTVYYDKLGREVCRYEDEYYYDTRYNAKGQTVQTSYPYKPLNKLDANKIWNKYTYDGYGRKITEKAPYTDLSYAYNNRKVTVTDNLRKIFSWKDYDALGRISGVYDAGGNISYHYSVAANKQHKTVITTYDAITTIFTDLQGNRLSIEEPNAGIITSTYNKFNELITQIDARGNTTTYQYDRLGRVTQKQYTAPNSSPYIVKYEYDNFTPDNRGRGKISQIRRDNLNDEHYTYDSLSRLVVHLKNGAFRYTYTPNGQLYTLTYPGSFSVTYSYTTTGKLKDIRRTSDNSLIYRVLWRNEFGATTLCDFGNDLATAYTYNPYGLLAQIKTGHKCTVTSEEGEILPDRGDSGGGEAGLPFEVGTPILHYQYTYNNFGLMTSRSEGVINQFESYTYDLADRLTGITTGKGGTSQIFSYYDNGNIKKNSKLGTYGYHTNKPHAVTLIMQDYNVIPADTCAVTYNFFNQPTQIEEGERRIELVYGADHERIKMKIFRNDTIEIIRSYADRYYDSEVDYINDSTRIWRAYHYIYADNNVVAMYVATRSGDTISDPEEYFPLENFMDVVTTDSMYYIHTDHLGSYCAITNKTKQVRQRNWFDPWGNYQKKYDTINWKKPVPTIIEIPAFPLTTRGFTGHEHYPQFKIINMNGRLYDPIICRFFSPDNFVQSPEATQGYNRYSYCLNNPLMYVDPSGQTWYDVDGIRRRIDDGIDDLAISVSQREFNRLLRKFEKNRNYDEYRDKMSYKHGFTISRVVGNPSQAGDGTPIAAEFRATYHEPGGQSYSRWRYMDNYMSANPGSNSGINILLGERGIIYSPINVGDFILAGIGVKALITAGARMVGENAAKTGTQFTKSSLQQGQQMHKAYKAGMHGKEFRLPSGKRIDYLDINNRAIYELKPYNPRGIQQGQQQLQMYWRELQTIPEFNGYNWKLILDLY